MTAPSFLMGVETEYAVHGVSHDGTPLDRDDAARALIAAAVAGRPWLSDGRPFGFFLANGARLYCDTGTHPELATPECADPWMVLRYVRAGDRLLADAAARAPGRDPTIARLDVFRGNVDYFSGSLWGSHESYLHRSDPTLIAAQLVPHLVSRIIYSGGGGFDASSPGPEFVLSPRVAAATGDGGFVTPRPLYDFRDESLARPGFRRLHVTLADTQCSDLGLVLRVGSTALALAAIEAGARPAEFATLGRPHDAARVFARDPTLSERACLENGGSASAIDIQRHYLRIVERHVGDRNLPEWAERLCRLWRQTLDCLERDPASLAATLDWPLKHAIFREWARERRAEREDPASFPPFPTWERFGTWGRAIQRVGRALSGGDGGARSELPYESRPPWQRTLEVVAWLRERGLEGTAVEAFIRLHREFLEADTRFGQLGEAGIFERLEAEGELEHRQVEESDVRAAIERPPPGRARIRGNWVRLLGEGGTRRHVADWTHIREAAGSRWLDLSDPFGELVCWQGPSGFDGMEEVEEAPAGGEPGVPPLDVRPDAWAAEAARWPLPR